MVLYDIYRQPEVKTFKTSVCTKATLFYILCCSITIISPLLIVFRSQGLWIKHGVYREQPNVLFKHELLVILETSDGVLAWSTNPSFNLLMEKFVRVPLVKSRENDDNYDGIKDDLELSIITPLQNTEHVHGVTVITTFDYRLHRHCKLVMEGAALVQHNSILPLAALHVIGDLTLQQRWPLPNTGRHYIYNTSVFPLDNHPENWRINNIVTKYWQRNITTRMENQYIVHHGGATNNFEISMHIKYSEQLVTYIPGFWFVIKWAWIQYLAVLVIIIYFISLIKQWVFENQIVSTWIELPKRKLM